MEKIDPKVAERVWKRVQAGPKPCDPSAFRQKIPVIRTPPEAWETTKTAGRENCLPRHSCPQATQPFPWCWLVLLWLLCARPGW